MSGPLDDEGPALCACGRAAEPGTPGQECHACAHGMPPEPKQVDPIAQAALFRRTAALMRKQAERARDEQYRENCLADAHYFERRAAELEP